MTIINDNFATSTKQDIAQTSLTTIALNSISDYYKTQFGQQRVSSALALSYIVHRPINMVSLGGTAAKHQDFSIQTSGTTTNVYNPNDGSVKLSVGTASGDRYTYRQDQYNVYSPGAQQRPLFTVAMGPANTNQIIRIGYFDDSDGIFFYRSGTTQGIGIKTSVSGSVVTTLIPQASFNYLPGVSWDTTKDNIYEMPFEWLGAGNIQYWLNHTLIHVIENCGINDQSWMKRGNLPLTIEIENLGTTSAGGFVKFFCGAIFSEGANVLPSKYFSVENISAITGINTTGRAILTIRPTSTISVGTLTGLDNRGIYVPISYGISNSSGTGIVEVYLDSVLGGSPSFSSTIDSGIEFDIASNTFPTGGEIISRKGLDAAASTIEYSLEEFSYPGRCLHNLAFSGQHQLTLAVKANAGTISATGFIRWKRIG